MSVSELLVKTYLYDVCPWINFSATNSRKVTYDESNEVMARMSSKLQAHELVTCTEILREVLIKNGLASEKSSPVSMIFSPDRVKARINERAMLLDPDLKIIDAGFMLVLENIDDFSLDEIKIMILYSAMRFGLLLNKDYLKQLNHCLYHPPQYYQGRIWYEFKIPEVDNKLIWNPDSLTLTLLGKWYGIDKVNSKDDDFKLDFFNEFLKIIKIKVSNFKSIKSLKSLENGISMVIANRIPAYINDIAKGESDSRTVNRECYFRLLTGMSPILNNMGEDKGLKVINKAYSSKLNNDDVFIKVIKEYFKNEKSSDISKYIIDYINLEDKKINPSMIFLGRWVAQRLTGKNYWGNKTSQGTIKKRFRYIAQDMIDVFEYVNPLDLSSKELCDLYHEIVENSDGSVIYKKALEDFHYYIQENEGAAKIFKAFPWSKKQKYQSVDANIITWRETSAIETYYWNKLKDKSIYKYERQLMSLRLIVYALGFYTGMRRQEIIGARISDITTFGRQIYNVRMHENRSLKSLNAIRQLPIWIYLPKDILELVDRYLKSRVESGAKPDDYLFDLSGDKESIRINERLVFNHIHWVMQGMTGHAKARFHHLRHSCGTWMLWKLSLPYLSNKNLGFVGIPEFTDEELIVYQENLLAHTNLKYPSEKILPEIARMLGHSNGGMSLGHYVHSAYWISNDYRVNLMPNLSTNLLAKLAGISVRQIQKLSGANDSPLTPDLIMPTLIKKLSKHSNLPVLTNWIDPRKKDLGEYKRELSGKRIIELDMWNDLFEYFDRGADTETFLNKYNIQEYEFDRYIQNAKCLFSEDINGRTVLYKIQQTKKELETVERMITNYHSLSDAKKTPVHIAVGYFKNNRTKNGVVFNSKEQLNEYLRIFYSLKLWKLVEDKKLPAFRLTLSSDKAFESSERANQWTFWQRATKFQSFQLSNKIDETISTNRGSLTVDYMSERKKGVSSITRRSTDRGFVLGMYIIATFYM
jgi:integrase